MLAAGSFGAVESARKNIVFVGSYHDNHVWTGNVRDAFEKVLRDAKIDADFRNIYLDSKNVSNRDVRRRMLAEMLKSGAKADVVVAADLEAAEAIIDVCGAEFPDLPVVIVSIWDKKDFSKKNIAVCAAEIGVEKTFLAAKKMLPWVKRFYVLADKTDTGEFYLREAKRQLEKYSKSAEFIYGSNADSAEGFLEAARNFSSDSAVILLTWQRDDKGVYHNPQLIYPALAKVSSAPVFAVIDNLIEGGFVGGYSLKASENGKVAAERTLEILRSGSVGNQRLRIIPPVPIFNDEALQRWKIDDSLVPPGAVILNEPPSFISQYFPPIVLSAAFVVLLLVIVFAEFFLHRRYRRLSDKNKMLYKHLENTLVSLPAGVEIYDDSGFLITANDADKVIFGMCGRGDSLVGSLNIFKEPNLSDEVKAAVKNSKPVDTVLLYDFDSVSKARYFETSLKGKKRIACRGAPIFSTDGKKWCYALVFMDLTEQLAKSHSLQYFKDVLDLAMKTCGMCVWFMDAKTYGFEILSGGDNVFAFKNLEDFFDAVAPEMRAGVRRTFDGLLGGKIDRDSLVVSYRNSEAKNLEHAAISVAGVSSGSEIAGIVGTFKKI